MADEGFVLLWRRFFSHPYWIEPRRFSRAEAWIDMIGMAAFKEHEQLVGPARIKLERGEFLASIRYLERRWSWGIRQVHEFLQALQTRSDLILIRETPKGNIYRLVNYETYQNLGNAKRNGKETERKQREVKKEERLSNESPKKAFEPTAEHLKLASELHIDAGREAEKFRDHVAAKGAKYKDQNAAFRNWLRRAVEYSGRQPTASTTVSVDDIRRCLQIGGLMLAMPATRQTAFELIQQQDQSLWDRTKDILPSMKLSYLTSLHGNGFELNRAIKQELENR